MPSPPQNQTKFDPIKRSPEVDYLIFSLKIISLRYRQPKSRFRKLSLRVKRSNPVFFSEIATHLSGARNDRPGERFCFLNRDLGATSVLTTSSHSSIFKMPGARARFLYPGRKNYSIVGRDVAPYELLIEPFYA